jgi:hypothetical protein
MEMFIKRLNKKYIPRGGVKRKDFCFATSGAHAIFIEETKLLISLM